MIHEAEEREGLVEKVGVGFGEVGLRPSQSCNSWLRRRDGGGESQGEVGRWRRHRMGWVGARRGGKEEEKIW